MKSAKLMSSWAMPFSSSGLRTTRESLCLPIISPWWLVASRIEPWGRHVEQAISGQCAIDSIAGSAIPTRAAGRFMEILSSGCSWINRSLSGIIGNTMNTASRIVIDTNVWVSALRSRSGWSFELLSRLGQGSYQHVVTVPLVMEYEDVLLRPSMVRIPPAAVQAVLDYLCATAVRQTVHFLWRPRLPDVKDDMVLEAAVNGQCQCIVTWNIRDFATASEFGIDVLNPQTYLNTIKGEKP